MSIPGASAQWERDFARRLSETRAAFRKVRLQPPPSPAHRAWLDQVVEPHFDAIETAKYRQSWPQVPAKHPMFAALRGAVTDESLDQVLAASQWLLAQCVLEWLKHLRAKWDEQMARSHVAKLHRYALIDEVARTEAAYRNLLATTDVQNFSNNCDDLVGPLMDAMLKAIERISADLDDLNKSVLTMEALTSVVVERPLVIIFSTIVLLSLVFISVFWGT